MAAVGGWVVVVVVRQKRRLAEDAIASGMAVLDASAPVDKQGDMSLYSDVSDHRVCVAAVCAWPCRLVERLRICWWVGQWGEWGECCVSCSRRST